MSVQDNARPRSLKDLKREGRKINQMQKHDFVIEDIYEKCTNSKLLNKLKTGLVFDDKFATHECIWDSDYPENPKRYTCIIDRFNEYNLIERCERIPNRYATREEICTLHDPNQVDLLKSTSKMTDPSELESLASQYDSVYFNQNTHMVSHLATGSVLNLVEAVVSERVQNGMAVVRPPGHHAMKESFCGYCYYNNVAIAARYALDQLKLSRVLIVDWDVHHGQATQQMFYDDPRVLYFSIHRYEQGEFWPNLRESNFDYAGNDAGFGYNINLPLNEIGCGDADYLTIFHSVLLPVAYEFEPDLVLVSAGYDAAIGCTEGQMTVSPGCYHHLTTALQGLARGKLVVCLEGGYFLPSLAESAAQTMKALLGDPAPRLESMEQLKPSVITSIYNVISVLRSKWKCFNHYNDSEGEEVRKHVVDVVYKGCELQPPFPTRNCYPQHTSNQHAHFHNEITRLRNSYKEQLHRGNKVGYVYDPVMELHKSLDVNHFEKPERLTRTLSVLKELALLERMEPINIRAATEKEISACHDMAYVHKVETLGVQSESTLKATEGWTTVFTSADSMQSARAAAGGLLELVTSVTRGDVASGVAVIRPPGHHAERAAASGFCLINNVAIAAKYALAHNLARRILIVDWDIHHGNGIQRMFYEEPRVLYVSLHRYDHGRFFPHSDDADSARAGTAAGAGFTVNVAWNDGAMTDSEYLAAWTRVVLPVAYQFDPDLVLVAAGFDACRGDPLGGYNVTPQAFGHLVQLLKALAGGCVVLALEGGYNVNSVAYSLAMCVKALLNDPLPPLVCGASAASAIHSIDQTIRVHQDRWALLLKHISFS